MGIVIIALLIAANGVYAGAEFALVAVNRYQVESLAKQGNRRARVTLRVLKDLNFEMSGGQLGISISSLLIGFLIEPVAAPWFRPLLRTVPNWLGEATVIAASAGMALIVLSLFQIVFGEVVPKNHAIARPLTTALWLAPLMRISNLVFRPIIVVLNNSATWTLRLTGMEPSDELVGISSLADLERVVRWSASAGSLHGVELNLLRKTINFANISARDVLVPRASAETMMDSDTLQDLVNKTLSTGFARYPVLSTESEEILGVVHTQDIFEIPRKAWLTTPIAQHTRSPLVVPSGATLQSVLVDMQRRRAQMALVADEHGVLAGLLTLEDLLEELIGETKQPISNDKTALDTAEYPQPQIVPGLIVASDLAIETGFHIPDGPYETLAGFLLLHFQRIPQLGDRLTYESWTFDVVGLEQMRITRVRVTPPIPTSEKAT